MNTTTQKVLDEFFKNADSAKEKAEKFLSLSYRQLNWRPAENRWSVAECFEHLVRTNEKYIPAFQKYLSDGNSRPEIAFRHSLIGKLILRSVIPDNKKKFKTRSAFNPFGSTINGSIVNDYLEQHKKMCEAVKNLDHSKFDVKITSPFSGLVKYKIGDSLIIIANHDLRHLNQAEQVTVTEGFPS
jgi:hypothetical protein